MKKNWTVSLLIVVAVCGMIFSPAVEAQALKPLYQAAFDEKTFAETGWNSMPSGAGEYQPASISLGLIPINPDHPDMSDGRGLILTALNRQGSLVYGPVIPVGDDPVILRLTVYALSSGGSIAVGALDAPPGGSIADADGSATYALEIDSQRFTGTPQRVTVLYRPRRKGIIPIFQLAIGDSATPRAVTAMFDNFEVFSLNANTLNDPALLSLLDMAPNPNPTPTVPVSVATPTPIPLPTATQTPTPGITAGGILVHQILILSPTNDQKEAYTPRTAYDRNDTFAVVAADLTQGYKDILLREIHSTDGRIDGPFAVNEAFQDTVTQLPDIAVDAKGIRHVIWSDNRSLSKLFSIYLAQIDATDKKINTTDFQPNVLYESTNATSPRIALLRNDGSTIVCWTDDRSYFMDLFLRRLRWTDAGLQAIDAKDFQINTPFDNTQVSHPAVAVDTNGNIVMVWSDNRLILDGKKRKDIFGRFFTLNTQPNNQGILPDSILEEQLSSQDAVYDLATDPEIVFVNGRFVTVWLNTDPNSGVSSIHGCVVAADGQIQVPEFIVDAGGANVRVAAPSLTAGKDNTVIITWYEEAAQQILARVYDAAQNAFLTDPTPLSQGVVGLGITSIAYGQPNEFITVWDSVTGNLKDIFGLTARINLDFTGAGMRTPTNNAPKTNQPLRAVTSTREARRSGLQLKAPRKDEDFMGKR